MTAAEGLAHSIHTRLVAESKDLGIEAQLLLERYALHRLLYRLSESQHADRFLLKGAQLMLIWIGEMARATRDVDLLGLGELSDANLRQILTVLCMQAVSEDDGMEYVVDSIRITPIREETAYGGRRIHLQAHLGNARLRLQIDIGIGDAVTPDPEWVELPPMLNLPAPRLKAYRPETSIAEKLETIVTRGLLNSRLKDYFDIYVLSMHEAFEFTILSKAIRDTLERRGTPIPIEFPVGLTQAFVDEPGRQLQWRSFLDKVGSTSVPTELEVVIKSIALFLGPVMKATQSEIENTESWPPGGPWQNKGDD